MFIKKKSLIFQEKEKQEQLSDILNSYSTSGLPPFPELMKIGQPATDEQTFVIENDWREIVHNSQVCGVSITYVWNDVRCLDQYGNTVVTFNVSFGCGQHFTNNSVFWLVKMMCMITLRNCASFVRPNIISNASTVSIIGSLQLFLIHEVLSLIPCMQSERI